MQYTVLRAASYIRLMHLIIMKMQRPHMKNTARYRKIMAVNYQFNLHPLFLPFRKYYMVVGFCDLARMELSSAENQPLLINIFLRVVGLKVYSSQEGYQHVLKRNATIATEK